MSYRTSLIADAYSYANASFTIFFICFYLYLSFGDVESEIHLDSFSPPSSFTIRHRGFKQLAKRVETSLHTTMQTRSITTHSTRDIYSMNANAPWKSKGHLLVSSFFVERLTNGIQQRHQKPSLVGFPKPCKNPFRGIRNKGIKRIRSTLPRENDVFANHINFS